MRRSSLQDATIVINWVFSSLSILIMLVRLVWLKIAKQNYDMGDYFTIGAIICAATRMGVIHFVIVWGTSNMPQWLREQLIFTPAEIQRRVMGSKLLLVNRLLYNT